MKLRAITDRGEHRDYLDLAAIELDGGRRAEEGMAYFVARFEPRNASEAVSTVLRSLAYLGDLEDNPALAVSIEESPTSSMPWNTVASASSSWSDRAIASLAPMNEGHGADVKALLRRHRPDSQWSKDLAAIRSVVEIEERS